MNKSYEMFDSDEDVFQCGQNFSQNIHRHDPDNDNIYEEVGSPVGFV